ncbi:hypothetical protein SAMN05192545_1645 [Maribacter dokdonensis]|uniref:VWFA domain-containing protein n=1 Tax=Maribacter dokdonensis TaxID=320912 RepID=A0ABY0UF11_9FLAO|nr:hypothetical protein [Maribacter dokdonensis]SDS57558.1 hypothetical protein SAMN05192545_1645 [Maribacter dokdonensis]
MQTKFQLLAYIAIILLISSCKSDKKEQIREVEVAKNEIKGECPSFILDNKENNLNISVFLDLSDRITRPKTIINDTENLKSISKAFTNHVKTKKLILLQDKIQLYFNPAPTNNTINSIAEKLHIEFDKNSPKAKIIDTEEFYAKQPSEIYNLALADSENPKDFPGSDIWRFFKDNVKDYTISDCHRNILVILTDGYMFHENSQMNEDKLSSYLTPKSMDKLPLSNSKWETTLKEKGYGFIKANDNLEDLEVLVIGIESLNPKNPYAIDVMRTYWTNWFKEMGVKKFKIQNADLASSVEKVIFEFINS